MNVSICSPTDATEEQLDFPHLYAGRSGWCDAEL
jgi:hypothetical protein